MSDVEINQLPAVAAIAPADVLPLDQVDATRGLTIAQLDARYAGTALVPFAWGDASPKPLLTVPAGTRVMAVKVIIDKDFDGAGATLAVGDDVEPERLVAAAENNPAEAGTYATTPGVVYAMPAALRLTISPGGGATQGAGAILITTD